MWKIGKREVIGLPANTRCVVVDCGIHVSNNHFLLLQELGIEPDGVKGQNVRDHCKHDAYFGILINKQMTERLCVLK